SLLPYAPLFRAGAPVPGQELSDRPTRFRDVAELPSGIQNDNSMSVVLPLPATGPAPGDGLAPLPDSYLPLLSRLEMAPPIEEAESRLVDRALGLWSRPGFETFVSLPALRFEPFGSPPHAAAPVLRR